jgi:nicotinamide-nucleotide amidase
VTDHDPAQRVADLAKGRDLQVGVVESLTCGWLAAALGAAPDASSWFRGGIVAYATEVKQRLLGVEGDRVVSHECARQMARAGGELLAAQAVVSATGVGGPGPSEGEPAGTVIVATSVRGDLASHRLQLDGEPQEVLDQAVSACLRLLEAAITDSAPQAAEGPDSR